MKTTVLTIGCYASTGGPSKSVRAFQRALDARIIAWLDPKELAVEPLVFQPDAIVPCVPWPGLRKVLYPVAHALPEAEEIVATSDLVSCHLFWRWHCPWLYQVASRHRIPYWMVPHGGLDPYVFQTNGPTKRLFAKTVARSFLLNAPAVVCSTQREYQKARMHLPQAEAFILPWPLEDADFRTRSEESRALVRGRLGISDQSLCLLFLGRLHPMKRPLETIAALARSGVTNAHLIIVGNEYGITVDDCKRQAQQDGVADRVHVVGPAFGESKQGYFDAADVFISLSHRENFNFAAAESLGCGVPVILSPGNDLAADLLPVGCGWMLPNIENAGEAIAAAAAVPQAERKQRGQRGRDWAENTLRFSAFQTSLRAYAARLAEEATCGVA